MIPSAHRLRTPDVYAEYDRLGLGRDADELDRLTGAVGGAAHDETLLAERLLHNDLETAARSLCPPIGDALADVRASGAARAMVSGSGPTVFGLFPGAGRAGAGAGGRARSLRGRHPGRGGRRARRPRVRPRRGRAEAVRPAWLAGAAALASTPSSAAGRTAASRSSSSRPRRSARCWSASASCRCPTSSG